MDGNEIEKRCGALELSQDRKENSKMLKEIPGLDKTVAVTVGNAVFMPRNEDNADVEYRSTKTTIDGEPFIIFHAQDRGEPQSVQLYPADAFDFEGISHLFRHGGIPLPFKQTVVMLALHKDDPEILGVAFDKEQLQLELQELMKQIGLVQYQEREGETNE